MKKLYAIVAALVISYPYMSGAAQQKYEISIPRSDEKTLQEKQAALEVETARLTALKKDVDERIAKYQDLLNQVQAAIQQLNGLSGQATARLIKVYETMPPSSTAQAISGLDDATAVKVMLMMKPRKAAAVMAALPPKKAASISSRILSLGKKIPIR